MSFSSGSSDGCTSYEVTTTEYVPEPPVPIYMESDRLIPSYHDTVIYTDTTPTYVVESDDSCFCLGGLCAAIFCCCPSD